MIVYIEGEDSFLARQTITSLKAKYLEKNPTGAELIEIDTDASQPSWADLKAVPLFATSRLVTIRRAGELPTAEQASLAYILKDLPPTTVVVVWDGRAVKSGTELAGVLATAAKKLSAAPLTGLKLENWIKKRITDHQLQADPALADELIDQYGNDLWAIETDLAARTSGADKLSSWGRVKADKPFALFDDVRSRRWTDLKRHLVSSFDRGEPLELTIGSLAAAVRQSVKDSTLRAKMVDLIADVDLALKTGFIEAGDAIALLVSRLPDGQNRVQWEASWQELS